MKNKEKSEKAKPIEKPSMRDIFLTKTINDAGIYAVKMYVNGIQKTIVVDDYVPFEKDENDEWYPAFAKSSRGDREIWMAIIEKAYAKVSGSYEGMET